MGWAARKLCESDDINQQQVIKEYFEHKEQRMLLEKQLTKGVIDDERGH
jgi:hypothetical protein